MEKKTNTKTKTSQNVEPKGVGVGKEIIKEIKQENFPEVKDMNFQIIGVLSVLITINKTINKKSLCQGTASWYFRALPRRF